MQKLHGSIEVNSAQVKIVKDAAEGLTPLPKTSYELSELLRSVLLAEDHEAKEAGAITRSTILFLKSAKQKADQDGWAYLSEIKYLLNTRAYFKDLSLSQKMRGIDAFKAITNEMVQLGVIKRIDTQIMATHLLADHITKLQSI